MALLLCTALIWSLYRSPSADDGGFRWDDPTPTPRYFDYPIREHPIHEQPKDVYQVDEQDLLNAITHAIHEDPQSESVRPQATPHEITIDDSSISGGGDIDIDLDRVLGDPADERGRVLP